MTEQVFLDLPETETFNVFRIEKFQVVPWKDIGVFYQGDSYIVLNAVKVGNSQRVERDIYFWLGKDSTQDERGTAAIKTVELDDRFGGEPTQHREVQEHESADFIKLFEKYGGVRYLDGGIESGFKKSTGTELHTMLFHIKGKRQPILQQVRASGESLNQGDCFILLTTTCIYLWIGKNANIHEKNKAAQSLSQFKSTFPKLKTERLDYGETSPEFWEALGGECPIKSASEGGADDDHESSNTLRIFEVNGETFTVIAEKAKANKSLLQSGKIYVVHRGESIVVYFGAGIDSETMKNGIQIGMKFLENQNLPDYTSIGTAKEGKPSGELALLFA